MKTEKQLAKQIREIKEILPADYFAHLPLDARVRKMFEEWKQLESERRELKNDCIRLASEIEYIGASDSELMYPELYKSYLQPQALRNAGTEDE